MTPPTSRPSVIRRLAAILSIALVVAVAISTIVLVLDRVGPLLAGAGAGRGHRGGRVVRDHAAQARRGWLR